MLRKAGRYQKWAPACDPVPPSVSATFAEYDGVPPGNDALITECESSTSYSPDRQAACTDDRHATDASCTCSDILTPLTALGVPFEIDDHKGPIIENRISSIDQVGSRWTVLGPKTEPLQAKCRRTEKRTIIPSRHGMTFHCCVGEALACLGSESAAVCGRGLDSAQTRSAGEGRPILLSRESPVFVSHQTSLGLLEAPIPELYPLP